MRCFKDYIGLKGCCVDTQPPSGFFINTLPGCTVSALAATHEADKGTWVQAWDDIQERAIRAFDALVKQYLIGRVRTGLVQGYSIFGSYGPGVPVAEITAGKYVGLRIRMDSLQPYMDVHIGRLQVYAMAPATVNLQVFDLFDGGLRYTKVLTLVAGLNEVNLDVTLAWARARADWFIALDGDAVQLAVNTAHGAGHGDCGCCNYATATAGSILSTLPNVADNFVGSHETAFGLSLDWTVRCSLDNWVCGVRDQLFEGWKNVLAREMIQEQLTSTRLSKYATPVNKDTLLMLKGEYDMAFQNSMKTLLAQLKVPKDVCFDCNTITRTVYEAPGSNYGGWGWD